MSKKIGEEMENQEKLEEMKDVKVEKKDEKLDAEKVQEIVKKAKAKGKITYEELAKELENTNPDQIDKVFDAFEEMGVNILNDDFEDEPDIDDLKEVENLKLDEITETSYEGISVDDPVRMYLREIGKIPLLSYDKELELAKRILEGDEEAKQELIIRINEYFSDGSNYTNCVNEHGESIWIEQSGLTWTGGEAGWRIYNSWNDTNEKGLLTATRDDNTLKIVLSEDEFFAKNPDAQGNGLRLLTVTANNEGRHEFFLQTTSAEHQKIYYYRCDDEFNIINAYPQNQIYIGNMYDEVCLWYWGLDESGNGFVENLIWGNKIKVDAEIMNEILQCSDVQVIQEGNIFGLLFDQNKKFLYGTDNDTHLISENGGIMARMASQSNTGAAGVDILSIAYAEKEYSEILYYLPDGTVLDGYGTILFMNEQMKCVQEVGRIVIRDSMGNVRKEIDIN